MCHLQSLGLRESVQKAEAGNVSTGPVEAGDQADFDRIAGNDEDGRYRRGRGLGCQRHLLAAGRNEHRNRGLSEIARQRRQPIVPTLRPAVFHPHVLALDIAALFQPPVKCG